MANKERHCVICKRELVDEKVPICSRCARNGVKHVKGAAHVVSGVVVAVGAALASTVLTNKKNNKS